MWMCDRCQSINDDSAGACPRCGAAPLTAGERPPAPVTTASIPAASTPPLVVVPQFGRPVSEGGSEDPPPPPVSTAPPEETFAAPAPYAQASAGAGPHPGGAPPAPGPSPAEKIAVGLGIGVLIVMMLGRLLNPIRLLFVAVGVGVIFLGHYVGHRNDAFRKSAVQASGRVTRLDQSGTGGDVYYYSVVDFVTREGTPAQFRDSQGSRPARNHVGDLVTVYYNPLAPTDAQLDSSLSTWGPIAMYVCGALVVLTALAGTVTRGVGDGDMSGSF